MPKHPLDRIDRKILAALQEDGRLPNNELAERVGLSPSPCLRRVKALEEAGVIARYVALVDPASVELPVNIFVSVSLERQVEARLDGFEAAVMARPEVLECYLMTGDADYLLRVVTPDTRAYERFLQEAIFTLPVVSHIRSSFALRTVKFTTRLPV